MDDREQNSVDDKHNTPTNARIIVQWGAMFILGAIAASYLLLLIVSMFVDQRLNNIMYEHAAVSVGVPLSAITALVLVFTLEHYAGQIEFEALGFKFKGASGPAIIWVICFLTLISGIKVLW